MLDFLPTYLVVLLYVFAALLGMVLGSGLNCLSFRIARHEKWSGSQRSRCPACGHTLAPYDLVPVFSYLFLRGKCRYCGEKISPRYPITEVALSLCFVTLLARFGLSFDMLTCGILCCCLFCLSLVDLETQLIPDRFLVIPAFCRAVQLLAEGGLKELGAGIFPGIVMGGAILILSLLMDKILKKESMGGGDIKLLAMLGMFFPFSQCLLLLILSCLIGILMAAVFMKVNAKTAFPFGPAISAAAWITLLTGEKLVSLYWSLFI